MTRPPLPMTPVAFAAWLATLPRASLALYLADQDLRRAEAAAQVALKQAALAIARTVNIALPRVER